MVLCIFVIMNEFACYTASIIITPSGSPTAGQSYSLECSISGTSDSATFQWLDGPTDNRTQLTSDGSRTVDSTSSVSQLQFSPLRASHGGQYTCQATVVGVTVEGTATVEINRKSMAVVLGTSPASCLIFSTHLQAEGDSACRVLPRVMVTL